MPGPVLVVVELQQVLDPDALALYQRDARIQIVAQGGEILARGGYSCLGEPPSMSLTIMRWPSERAFIDWQESEEFQPLRILRDKGARLRMAIVPV